MKISMITVFLGLPLLIFSQITLTESEHNPDVGDSFEQNINSSVPASFNVGPSGANVTWDFSSLTDSSTAPVDIEAANNADFPDADIYYEQSGSRTYFETSNSAFNYLGIEGNSFSTKLSDGEEQVRFPMTYGDAYTDTKAGTFSSFGQTFQRSGVIEVKADGYGTLITPEATYSDALRIQIVRNDTDYQNGVFVSAKTDSIYYWYEENTNFTVMTYFRSYVDGSPQPANVNYLTDDDNSVGVIENTLSQNVRLYPNPVESFLFIENLQLDRFAASIYDIKGRLLNTYQDEKQIPVQNLKSGVYFLKIRGTNEQEVLSYKFIRE